MHGERSASETDNVREGRFLARLSRLVDDSGLITDPTRLERYASDWTRKYPCPPIAVARPRNTAEVSAVLALCHAEHQPVVLQGGLTGLAGGATPHRGELSISLERLQGIEDLDPAAGHMIVRAGTTLATTQDAAAGHGLAFPLDLPSRGTCTIGGNIATNAGGNRVIRYGMTRNLVLGLEAVLADGRVLTSLGTFMKDNAGYDLKHLFIGTEGTLGVVTRAVLRLHAEPAERMTALIALPSFGDLAALLATLRRRLGPGLCSFEAMWDNYFECSLQTNGFSRPFDAPHPFYALVEVELQHPAVDRERIEEVLFSVLEQGGATDAIVAASLEESLRLWQIRESAGAMLARLSPTVAHDISMPLARMDAFVEDMRVRSEGLRGGRPFCAFGHLGDGNLHLFTGLRAPEDAAAMDALVYRALEGFGSISAEHGVGVGKKDWLGITRSAEEIAVMRSLKGHLDPHRILNRSRIV